VWSTPEKDRLNTSVPVVVINHYDGHGHNVARSLGRLGIPVYGVHADAHAPAARSRYWRENISWDFEKASADASVDWLLQLARRIGPRPILIPTSDSSCLFVADHAAALRQGFLFPNQPAGLARALCSKKQMYGLCRQYAIPTPETVFPQSLDDVVAFLRGATFPVMLKRIDYSACGGTNMRVVLAPDAATVLKHYDTMEAPDIANFMLQEYIPGGSEMVWMFNGYFDEESRCLFGLTGKKIRQYRPYTGMTSLGLCVTNDTVARQTRDFMKAIGYQGILDIGYKYDVRTGQYKLLDANPRIGATFRLFIDTCGLDVARVLYRDLTGQPVAPGAPREGRKRVVEDYDVASALTLYRDGKLGVREWIRSFQGVQETCWLAPDDPAPFFAIAQRSLHVASRWSLEKLFVKA
jgi:predicted ATP-grasp superfamily ATP-dependent carboligase